MGTRADVASPGCLQQHPEESCRDSEVRELVLGLPGSVLLLARGVQGQLWEALLGPMGEGGSYGWAFFPNLNYSL